MPPQRGIVPRQHAHGRGEAEARDVGKMLSDPAFPLGLKRAEAAALRQAFALPAPPAGADGSFAPAVPVLHTGLPPLAYRKKPQGWCSHQCC